MNRLYFGDNLLWLQNTKEFPDASVDLVYVHLNDAHRPLNGRFDFAQRPDHAVVP